MSFKRKLISTVTLALAVGTFSTFAAAQDSSTSTTPQDSMNTNTRPAREGYGRRKFGKEGRGDHGDMMMGELHQLNLTDAQKTQIKTLMETNRASNQGTFQEMRGLMMKKRDGSITAEEQTRLDALKTQSKAAADQTHNSILAILTPEQQTQLAQLKEQRKQQMMEHRQMRQNKQTPPSTTDNN